MRRIEAEITARGLHPADVVVLLPYAQLMQEARRAWTLATAGRSAFVPRFETTQNWARSLGGVAPGPGDLRQQPAWDLLTATGMLSAAGLGTQRQALAQPLLQAAMALARVAAAVPPGERAAWGERSAAMLGAPEADSPLHLDAWLARIALAWVASSGFATDVLFAQAPALLVQVRGLQADPLAQALLARRPGHSLAIDLDQPAPEGAVSLHEARDAEDEAERATACVLAHRRDGRLPVALVAQDRYLVRRVRALLANRGVQVRDETGWTLATTRAAAAVMALARALAHDASGDAQLDGLKHAPALDPAAVQALEARMRRRRAGQGAPAADDEPLLARLAAWRAGFDGRRRVAQWLDALRDVLQQAGLWSMLELDAAGHALIEACCLAEPASRALADHGERLSQGGFLRWLAQVLESGSFVPPHPEQAEVVILPLAQLLGRSPAAVVFPGADEARFPLAPEPSGPWTAAQRLALGLGSREDQVAQTTAAWRAALRAPCVDVLWRISQRGEPVLASPLVLAWQLAHDALAPDPRGERSLTPAPQSRPAPVATGLPLERVSASAYGDLRLCPYRFFASTLLRLDEAEEVDQAPGRREFGTWLHAVLASFHERLPELRVAGRDDLAARRQLADTVADETLRSLRLPEADFLPFLAAWPRVRDAYLEWLAKHEVGGHRFRSGEQALTRVVEGYTLHGRVDRLDTTSDGALMLIDYKTESSQRTKQRVAAGSEDVQLPFYAALLPQAPQSAWYLSLSDQTTEAFARGDIARERGRLLEGLVADLRRIEAGAPMRALGVGEACTYCRARGLCRKDGWAPAKSIGARDA